jgi:4-amino-4-deoxy-L-arabinose transferase-like glycosyltransferase
MFRLNKLNSKSKMYSVIWLLVVIALVRVLGIVLYPLNEPSEARYAEIARKMLETQQWIMPQFDYGVPFWGKPPLSFWLTALSFDLFGVNTFAARLPSLLLAGFMLWLTYLAVAKIRGKTVALMSVMILASTVLFFIAGGAVITDTALAACVTISMLGFWLAMDQDHAKPSGLWAYLFFIGLGLGLLAKGPLVLVLVFLPVISWTVLQKKGATIWRALPWISGIIIMLAISIPWYVLAEVTSPGFLNYFIVGEHFYRFVDPEWQGNLYGGSHAQPKGKIWLSWVYMSFPWSLIFLYLFMVRIFRRDWHLFSAIFKNPWQLYLLLWAITPMVFFSLSSNILDAYVLPGLPAFAISMAEICHYFMAKTENKKHQQRWVFVGYVTPLFGLVFLLAIVFDFIVVKSQKPLIEIYHSKRIGNESRLIYLFDKPYAADFYTQGKAKLINPESQEFSSVLNDKIEDFFIVRNVRFQHISKKDLELLVPVATWRKYTLLRDKGRS